MLIIIETGVMYNEIIPEVIENELAIGHTFAWCTDPVSYNTGERRIINDDGDVDYIHEEPSWSREITKAEKDEAVKRVRAMYYREEADPLFFKAKRGECKESEWVTKVNEIRERIK